MIDIVRKVIINWKVDQKFKNNDADWIKSQEKAEWIIIEYGIRLNLYSV